MGRSTFLFDYCHLAVGLEMLLSEGDSVHPSRNTRTGCRTPLASRRSLKQPPESHGGEVIEVAGVGCDTLLFDDVKAGLFTGAC